MGTIPGMSRCGIARHGGCGSLNRRHRRANRCYHAPGAEYSDPQAGVTACTPDGSTATAGSPERACGQVCPQYDCGAPTPLTRSDSLAIALTGAENKKAFYLKRF